MIAVEVVFAVTDRQELLRITVPGGSTVQDVIGASSLATMFPEYDFGSSPVGIWGRVVRPEHVVAAGDRVEIYRPLERDPREARRALAAEGRTMGRPEGDS